MKMFSGSEDYDVVESTGYESYGENGYSSPFSHWLEDDDVNSEDDLEPSIRFFRD